MITDELLVEAQDGVGHLILNRPRAINALTPGMLRGIHTALDDWAADGSIVRVELSGSGERGLCSGADVRALREHVLAGGDFMEFFEVEYALDGWIASYPKPLIAHMRGVTMGGGLGLSAHARRRVLYEDSKLAMPETMIGFSPDAGVLWELSRAPGEWGTHLALTSEQVGAQEALAIGLGDEVRGDGVQPRPVRPPAWMAECYVGADPVEIVGRLADHPEPAARAAAARIRRLSPFAVCVALEAVRRAAAMPSVHAVLAQDLALAPHLIGGADFLEGVRALLVDKDGSPKWRHERIEDVDRSEVLACFSG